MRQLREQGVILIQTTTACADPFSTQLPIARLRRAVLLTTLVSCPSNRTLCISGISRINMQIATLNFLEPAC
jgi:hypothetical protein